MIKTLIRRVLLYPLFMPVFILIGVPLGWVLYDLTEGKLFLKEMHELLWNGKDWYDWE